MENFIISIVSLQKSEKINKEVRYIHTQGHFKCLLSRKYFFFFKFCIYFLASALNESFLKKNLLLLQSVVLKIKETLFREFSPFSQAAINHQKYLY